MTSTSSETKLGGITIAAIDRCYDDVLPTIPNPFIYTERDMMTRPLQLVVDQVRDTTLRLSRGDAQESTRTVVGFLFAHRLVRETVPDYRLWVNDRQELLQRIEGPLSQDGQYKDETKPYFPTLTGRFPHHPEVLDHLIGKFTNRDSRYGAQVLLLCLPDHLRIEAAAEAQAS